MNTLKFGNGEWYGKKDTILAYNDENSNYKPLPFSFERGSGATVVNKDGLIETVGSDMPRIDYKDNSKGALLLEPQRSNLITYSEAFDNSYWTKIDASVVGGFSAPDGGNNSFKLIENTNNSAHIIFASPSITLGNNIFSVFAKASERRVLGIEFPTNGILVSFDLIDGVFVNSQANPDGFSITPYANGWYRIDIQEDLTSTSVVSLSLRDDNGNRIYQGDGTSGIYIYGAQLEQGSYATSYIPTQGSTVTRLAESCSQTAPDGVIGQTEGTLYAEIKANETSNASGRRTISLSDGTNSNRVYISFDDEYNKLNIFIVVGGTTVTVSNVDISNQNTYNKVAVRYNSGNSAIYVNGVLKNSFNDTFSSGVFNTLKFQNRGSGEFFNGNCKDLRVYNEALTDVELKALTTI